MGDSLGRALLGGSKNAAWMDWETIGIFLRRASLGGSEHAAWTDRKRRQ